MKQATIHFSIGSDKMEIVVEYDRKEPENYTVVFANHNGRDVTDFYRFCEAQNEALFYPQIVEGIAREIGTERIEKRQRGNQWSGTNHLTKPASKAA